jgi:adenylate kinase
VKLVIIGPPGSGKGTQAAKLCDYYKIPRISTGDLLRHEMKNKTELGGKIHEAMETGNLVPDPYVVQVLAARLSKKDCRDGYVLDGFPRTVTQAHLLVNLTDNDDVDKAIYISCSDEHLLARLTARRICPNCDRIYSVVVSPPNTENVCDICQAKLIQRPDDKEVIVADRIAIYHKMTEPVIDYFEKEGLLVRINGEGNIEDISKAIFTALEG